MHSYHYKTMKKTRKEKFFLTLSALSISLLISYISVLSISYPLLIMGTALLAFSWGLVLKANKSLSMAVLSPTGLFFILYCAYIYIGISIFFFSNTEKYLYTFWLVNFFLLFFCLGANTSSNMFHFKKQEIDDFFSSTLVKPSGVRVYVYLGVVIIFICGVIPTYFYLISKDIPALSSRIGYAIKHVTGRGLMTGIYYFFPYACLIFLISSLRAEHAMFHKVLSIISCCMYMILLLLFLLAHQIGAFMLYAIIALFYTNNGKADVWLKPKKIFALSASLLSLFVLARYLRLVWLRHHDVAFITFLVESVLHRVFITGAFITHGITEVIPKSHDYFGFYIFIDQLKALMPGVHSQFSFGKWLYPFLFGGTASKAGYATPTIITEAYASFGNLSLLFGFVFGFFSQYLFIRLIRGSRDTVRRVTYAVLFVFIMRASMKGIFASWQGFIPFAAFYIMFRLLRLNELAVSIYKNINIGDR